MHYSINMLNTYNLFVLGYWYIITMSSNVHPLFWNGYLKSCAMLGYQPEATVEINLLQCYKTLYTRYCQENGLDLDPTTNLDSDVDMDKFQSCCIYIFVMYSVANQ
jgi:hypothetical protein